MEELMTAEGAMTYDEKWLSFYYFWKLQYELRGNLIKNNKKFAQKRDDLVGLKSKVQCKLYNTTVNNLDKPNDNIFMPLLVPDFPCFEYNSHCSHCSYRDKIIRKINTIKRYSNLKHSLRDYLFTDDQLIIDSTNFLIQIMLSKQKDISGETLLNAFIYDTPVQRKYVNAGIKLLGIENLKMIETGHLSGKIIAEIDLSCSTSFLCLRIESLKSLKFIKTPTFDNLNSEFKIERMKSSTIEKKIIKDNPDMGCKINAFESRAIGLWLYDVITTKQYTDFDDAYEALKNGHWRDNKLPEKSEIPANALYILGKGNSERRVITRLYEKTQNCVIKREVLNLK